MRTSARLFYFPWENTCNDTGCHGPYGTPYFMSDMVVHDLKAMFALMLIACLVAYLVILFSEKFRNTRHPTHHKTIIFIGVSVVIYFLSAYLYSMLPQL
jgi:hypothetical protein